MTTPLLFDLCNGNAHDAINDVTYILTYDAFIEIVIENPVVLNAVCELHLFHLHRHKV